MLLANQNTDSDYLQCIILELGKLPTLVQYCHNFTTTMYLLVTPRQARYYFYAISTAQVTDI